MYKQLLDVKGMIASAILRDNGDSSSTTIPFDPANTDYQEFLKWLAEGNEPLPADEV